MGAASSSPAASGLVTVSKRQTPSSASQLDPDLAALQRLPPVSPLVKQPTLRGILFAGSRPGEGLPELDARNISALCREYASISRQAALPICEEQRTIAKKMSGVEALCARVLYLMALRSTELSSSTATMRELGNVTESIRQNQATLQQLVARAQRLDEQLDRMMPPSYMPNSGGALG